MVDSRAKGAEGEKQVKDLLRKHTGLPFERVPMSGALPFMKGDLFVPDTALIYCIEVKFYKDDAISTKVFTNKSNNFVQWWAKTVQQAEDNKLEPLLFFKANHAQFFVSTKTKPEKVDYMYISMLDAYICLAEKWLEHEKQEWTHGDRIYEPWKATDS